MKKLLLMVVCFTTISFCSLAQEPVKSVDLTSVTIEQNNIKREFNSLRGEVSVLKNKNAKAESRISALESLNKDLSLKLDSLQKEYDYLANNQKADKSELSTIIGETNEKVLATEQILSSRTLWGICGIIALIVALAATVWAFMKKIKSGSTSIDDVRKAQSSLEEAQENIRKAQEKMQEETIQLDNKLIEVLSKQSVSAPTTTDDGEIDHSLTLKVADEIVKIEMNLSRMDESIKGYKQLSRGVQRIKDNFKANDYEIVDMLGKPYQAGMKAAVTFVTDDTLEPGQQIISRIIKPQVNYKQVMIQAAQIEVSQAE
jgi:chromosome segregation ATPase